VALFVFGQDNGSQRDHGSPQEKYSDHYNTAYRGEQQRWTNCVLHATIDTITNSKWGIQRKDGQSCAGCAKYTFGH